MLCVKTSGEVKCIWNLKITLFIDELGSVEGQ